MTAAAQRTVDTVIIPDKIVYTAEATSTGGRVGRGKTPDGKLDLVLDKPVEMGGKGEGVNPEQLFAIGYSACFLGATKFVAKGMGVTVPNDARVDAAVSIGPIPGGFGLAVELKVSMPGLDKATVQKLADEAHAKVCPYSNATRGNVDVKVTVA